MKYTCLYSIVRFAPFAETEEFANVGIVLSAPAIGRMEYKLARKNLKRVNHFFECLFRHQNVAVTLVQMERREQEARDRIRDLQRGDFLS